MPASGHLEGQVIASGAVRSIVRMTKKHWHNEMGNFNITRTATIYAHQFETEIQDVITVLEVKSRTDVSLGTGMKKEENKVKE